MTMPGAAIVDACAVRAHYGNLLVLKSGGQLCGVNMDDGSVATLCRVELPDLPIVEDQGYFGTPAWKLHATMSGSFCAIVVDKGRTGLVVDLASGAITMTLDGGDYFEDTVPFSACFLRYRGADVFVHRTAWNRLEASDPATGHSHTSRYIAPNDVESSTPQHYLDYFHGRLLPSPDGCRLLDDGWVWHPSSIPRIWSASDWLGVNPFESEDGPSLVSLTMRENWNTPACWISDHRLAMWGLVSELDHEADDPPVRPGLQISDVSSRERSLDEQWPIDMQEAPRHLLCDGQRIFIAGSNSTIVWDLAAGAAISTLPGFSPSLYDANRGTLLSFDANTLHELVLC